MTVSLLLTIKRHFIKEEGGFMAEPMKRRHKDDMPKKEMAESVPQEDKKFFSKAFNRVKDDFKHGSRVEDGSLIDGTQKLFRSLFPKKR